MNNEPKFKVGDTVILDYGDEEDYAIYEYGSEGVNRKTYKIIEVRESVEFTHSYTYKLSGTNYHLERWLRHLRKIIIGGERQ